MRIDIHKTPHEGDSDAFEAIVWDGDEIQFILKKKLSRTELHEGINKNCVANHAEALEKLKQFTLSEAKTLYNNKQYKKGDKYEGDFSPCW